ncbi:MAG: hypothetical protein D6806_14240 [Deltaproteobacteria bacterium]|nr:MAG: hypothetical protein D6806_14240 [Deltaproteobacteria bacterium]
MRACFSAEALSAAVLFLVLGGGGRDVSRSGHIIAVGGALDTTKRGVMRFIGSSVRRVEAAIFVVIAKLV